MYFALAVTYFVGNEFVASSRIDGYAHPIVLWGCYGPHCENKTTDEAEKVFCCSFLCIRRSYNISGSFLISHRVMVQVQMEFVINKTEFGCL